MFSRLWQSLHEPPPDEGRMLLFCARTVTGPAVREELQTLAARNIDWAALRDAARDHQVMPLLHHNLSEICPASVPADITEDMRQIVDGLRTHNEKNLDTLLDILRALEDAGIEAMSFKGVASALDVYGDLGLRQCGDIDLLVRRQDFLKAKDILIRRGYGHTFFGHHEVATAQAQLGRGGEHPIAVDLHYGITPYCYPNMPECLDGSSLPSQDRNRRVHHLTHWLFHFDCDSLWERSRLLPVRGARLRVAAAEDALLIAIVQGVKDSWRFLRRICDVAEIVRANPALDWQTVTRRARKMYFERKLLVGLRLARDLLDMPVDPVMGSRLQGPGTTVVALQTRKRMFERKPREDRGIFRSWTNLLSMDTLPEAIPYLAYALRTLTVPDHPARTRARRLRFLRALMGHMLEIAAAALRGRVRDAPRA